MDKYFIMTRKKIIFIVFLFTFTSNLIYADGQFESSRSFNPVGSGARAIAMGGAFINGNDATTAKYNPAGLVRVDEAEFSIVLNYNFKKENNSCKDNFSFKNEKYLFNKNINFFSKTIPYVLFNRNMVLSFSYQELYDLIREWNFIVDRPELNTQDEINYKQNGKLSSLSVSNGIQIFPSKLSFGFTINFLNNKYTENEWKKEFSVKRSGILSYNRVEKFSIKGININFGLLWEINKQLSLGCIYKSSFKASVEHIIIRSFPYYKDHPVDTFTKNENLIMPSAYGIGISYHYSNELTLSSDIYSIEWNKSIYIDEEGSETSLISGKNKNNSNVSQVYQVRLGFEYLYLNKNKGFIIPIRGGLFYDPSPSENKVDHFWGISSGFGFGFTNNSLYRFDIAYVYRFGRNVGTSMLQNHSFSQDVDEHQLYSSVIVYY